MHVSKTSRFVVSTRKNFVAGLFVIAPIAAVFWIIARIWSTLQDLVLLIPDSLHPTNILHIENAVAIHMTNAFITVLMLLILVSLIWWAGFFSRYYLGQQIIGVIRSTVTHIPVLRTVYTTLEQLLETFSGNKTKNFRKVIEIEFPRKGMYTMALVTGEKNGMLTAYVPTTPNPTGGYYIMIDPQEARELDISVEDALKEIISMGLVKKHDE